MLNVRLLLDTQPSGLECFTTLGNTEEIAPNRGTCNLQEGCKMSHKAYEAI